METPQTEAEQRQRGLVPGHGAYRLSPPAWPPSPTSQAGGRHAFGAAVHLDVFAAAVDIAGTGMGGVAAEGWCGGIPGQPEAEEGC
eukprot:scaffold2910_cov390-Prasinococcus_capsulatus_cf.AAC.31